MTETKNAIIIENLTVKFGDFTAVDDVSFSVREGEIFGFLGANGAGKTTTIRVMCGLLLPASGSVEIAGKDLSEGSTEIKKRVGYMSQKFTLYEDLTAGENISFKAALRKMPETLARKRKKELFELIDYSYPENMLVRDLPSGIKQQLALCATLLHDPEIIFLDEPTSGVAPSVRAKFWELIRALSKKGKTVIVTTHYMDEAEECERIALMRTGRIIALDSPEGLKEKAYPAPLVEITAQNRAKKDLFEDIVKDPLVEKAWPYGLKFHAALKEKGALEKYLSRLPDGCAGKKIKPHLEDVFMKLVESKEA